MPHTNTGPGCWDNTSWSRDRFQTQWCALSQRSSGALGPSARDGWLPASSSQWDSSGSSSGSIVAKPRRASARASVDFPDPGLPVTRKDATTQYRSTGRAASVQRSSGVDGGIDLRTERRCGNGPRWTDHEARGSHPLLGHGPHASASGSTGWAFAAGARASSCIARGVFRRMRDCRG